MNKHENNFKMNNKFKIYKIIITKILKLENFTYFGNNIDSQDHFIIFLKVFFFYNSKIELIVQ